MALRVCPGRAAAGLLALLAAPALAYINPKFTPVHVVRQSEAILLVAAKATARPAEWTLATVEALKGKSGGASVLDLAAAKESQAEQVAKLLAHNGKAPLLLFAAGRGARRQAFLHVAGHWLSLKASGTARWQVQGIAASMSGVYAGGTDTLARMTRYLLADPDGSVPTSVGTRWMGRSRLAKAEGVTGMATVELKSRGRLHLFVAAASGDRLFRPKPDDDAMEEVTAAAKLDTSSRQFAWADLDRDGLADLVTWDGTSLAVRRLAGDGTLAAASPKRAIALGGQCLGLDAIGVSRDGAPAILVSAAGLPCLIRPDLTKAELPSGEAVRRAGRRPSRCIVADLDNDGFADVLQPRERGGLLWRGCPDGFARPEASAVRSSGGARVALGDFNADGLLDIFLSNGEHNQLWENDGKAGFRAVIDQAGSLSYKTPAGVSWCAAMDLNHDGRPDLALGYADTGFVYHFNRGYRCLGEEGGLRLIGPAFTDGPPRTGVVACAAGDFNGDDGQDLAVAFVGGELYAYYNDLCDMPTVGLRLSKGRTGPVTVSVWQGDKRPFCTGAAVVSGHTPPACVSLRRPGRCTLKYRLPGQPVRSRDLTVGERRLEAVLGE